VLFKGKPFKFQRPYGSYVMENVLFKISFPAEFHADRGGSRHDPARPLKARHAARTHCRYQAAITIRTHEACIRIIDKKGPLEQSRRPRSLHPVHGRRAADVRRLTASDYEDDVAVRPAHRCAARQNRLRGRRAVHQGLPRPDKRSIANALTVEFNDGSKLDEVVVEYPIGHRRRRADGIPLLEQKFRTNLARRFPAKQQKAILDVSLDQEKLEALPVNAYVDLYVI
jgi:2-methylcitrate dehydratase